MSVTLSHNGKKYGKRLHILVAAAFLPNPEHKDHVYNANCDIRNCRVDNLFWVSEAECNKLSLQQTERRLMLQELKNYHQLSVSHR